MATWSQPESVVITLRETYSICGYTRISVDLEEDRDNTSIENQKAIIEDYVRRTFPGSTLDLYVDRDRSGYTFEQREQYQAMRRKMLRQQYDILIVKDLSRFSRRNGHGLVELETLRDAGIRIIAIGDNIDYPTNDDWMRIQIYFFMNEMPVTDTSKKVRNVIKRADRMGKSVHIAGQLLVDGVAAVIGCQAHPLPGFNVARGFQHPRKVLKYQLHAFPAFPDILPA